LTLSEYKYLSALLKRRSGLMLGADKQYLVESRLGPLIRKGGHGSITGIVQKMMCGDEAVIVEVVEAMTTNETYFFRDRVPFDHFRDLVLPELLQSRQARRSLRIWCAGSSTGQEPYSLAIYLKQADLTNWRIEIVAADISREAVERARTGLFTQFEVQRGLPIQMLMRYFSQEGDFWRIDDELREMVQHRQLNLIDDFSDLGTFDLIYCRNVLIYFDRATKQNIFARLHSALEPDGFLALGSAETVFGLTPQFTPCPDRRGFYSPVASPSIVPDSVPGFSLFPVAT
jgi:chemotaxis protein methyltransferase CheR